MSNKKKILNTKVAAGAALVALSGFVPQVGIQQAHAAATTINVSGSFITGIQLSVANNVSLGKLLAVGATGTAQLSGGGAFTVSNNVVTNVGAPPAEGLINATFADSGTAVDITVSGFTTAKALTLNTGGGAAPTGSITFTKLLFADALAVVIQKTAGTVGKATAIPASTAADSLKVGARIAWTGGQPIGRFVLPAVVTIAY